MHKSWSNMDKLLKSSLQLAFVLNSEKAQGDSLKDCLLVCLGVKGAERQGRRNKESLKRKKITVVVGKIQSSDKQSVKQSQEIQELMQRRSKLVFKIREKEVNLDSKIFKGEENTAGRYLALTEKEERQAESWNAAPTSGDILSDQRVITTLMTQQQLAEQKYKKEQYYGRVFYGGLIFLGFVIIYVIIIAQQLDIEETFLISRDSTKNFKDDVTENLEPKYSDYEGKMVGSIIPNLATLDAASNSYRIQGQLVLVNSIYRVTFRFADVNNPEPRKLNNFKEKPYAQGEQTSDFTNGVLGNYRTNDGYLGNGGFVQYINAGGVRTKLQDIHNSFSSQVDRLWYITYEYVVYEGSTDRFLNTVIRFLFRKDGSIEGKVDNNAIRLNPYFTSFDKFRIFLEICYVIFLVFFIIFFIRMVIREYRGYNLWYQLNIKPLGPRLMKLRNQKRPEWLRKFLHVFTFFKIFDMASMVTSILSICFWIVYIVRSTQAEVVLPLNSEPDQRNFFQNLNQAITFLDLYTKACSVNTLFMSIRMLKFLNENQQMSVLCKTLINGRLDIFWFMIILFCIMFGFVALANIQFGAYSERASTFWFSSIMCFQFIIGQFSYQEQLGVTNQVLAPLFFVVYMLLFAMILINIFLTIIDTSYQDVKRKVKLATGKQKLSTCNILCFCFKKKNTKRGNLGIEEKDQKEFEYYNERMLTEKKQLELLEIDLSTQLRDQNAWTLRMAEEIKRELDFRVKMRKDNAEMRKQRKQQLQGGGKSKKTRGQKKEAYSEFKEFYIRISYWNYLREAIQFVNFQCDRLVVEINKLKEKNIKEEQELQKMKGESKTVYQVIKDMEKPMEDNLKNISTLRKQIKKLRKQYTELNSVKSDLRRKYQNE